MSLEEALRENTTAVLALTEALKISAVRVPVEQPIAEVTQAIKSVERAKEQIAAAVGAAANFSAEENIESPDTEPEVLEEGSEGEEPEPEIETPQYVLPEGKRDPKYYEKNLLPHVVEMANTLVNGKKVGLAALSDILKQFGVAKASLVPPDRWDELYKTVKEKTVELQGV